MDHFERKYRIDILKKFKDSYSKLLKRTSTSSSSLTNLAGGSVQYFELFKDEFVEIFKENLDSLLDVDRKNLPMICKIFSKSIISYYQDNKEIIDIVFPYPELLNDILENVGLK